MSMISYYDKEGNYIVPFNVIESDYCYLYAEQKNDKLFVLVREDGFDGKVNAMTTLNREEAIQLRGYLNQFIGEENV